MDKHPFPDHLESDRVFLNRHDLSVAGTMFRGVDADRARLGVFLPWVEATRTVEDETAYIRATQEAWAQGTAFDYGMFERVSGAYMGNIGLNSIRWEHACCEVGYWILGAFEGNGYVSEAVSTLEDACFRMGFHRVVIRCDARNQRSARVPGRLGYLLEGVLRGDTCDHGEFRDTMIFGKLRPAGDLKP